MALEQCWEGFIFLLLVPDLKKKLKTGKEVVGFFQQEWKQYDNRIPTALLFQIWSCSSGSSPFCAILYICCFLYVGTVNCQVPVFI